MKKRETGFVICCIFMSVFTVFACYFMLISLVKDNKSNEVLSLFMSSGVGFSGSLMTRTMPIKDGVIRKKHYMPLLILAITMLLFTSAKMWASDSLYNIIQWFIFIIGIGGSAVLYFSKNAKRRNSHAS